MTSDDPSDGARFRCALVGFAVAAAIPVSVGAYGVIHERVSNTSCGIASLVCLILVFVVGPFCGLVGAIAGWVGAALRHP